MISFRSLPILPKQRFSISSALATWFPLLNSFHPVIHTPRFEGMQIESTSFVPFYVATATRLSSRGRSRGWMEVIKQEIISVFYVAFFFLSSTNKRIPGWANIATQIQKCWISVTSRIASYFGTANRITCVKNGAEKSRHYFSYARNQPKGAYG